MIKYHKVVHSPLSSPIRGSSIRVSFDEAFTSVDIDLRIRGGENVTRAHFHCKLPGANGPIALPLFETAALSPLDFDGKQIRGTLTNADFADSVCGDPNQGVGRPVNNIAALAFAMREGLIYANVHTSDVPGGEVRGQLLED